MDTPLVYPQNADHWMLPADLTRDLDPDTAGRLVFRVFLAGAVGISIIAWALGVSSWFGYAFVVGLTALVSLALNGRGHTRAAVVLMLLTVTICAFIACLVYQGVDDVAASIFPVVIVLAGMTLERRLLVSFTAFIITGAVGISLVRWWILHTQTFTHSQQADLVMLILTYALTALITVRLVAFATRSLQLAKESERRFRSLFENAGLGIYRTTVGGRIDVANPALVEMLGYESFAALAESNLGESGLVAGNARSTFFQTLDREGFILGVESAWTRKNNSVLWVRESVRAIKDENGTVRAYEGIVEDITERKLAEDALRASENKYRALVETTDTGYLILNPQGQVTDANQQYVKLTGHEQLREILGRSVTEWTAPYDQERNAAEVRKCVERGLVRNLEVDYVDRQGKITPIEINATVIEREDTLLILALCRDITERKTVRKELLSQREFTQAILDNISDGVVACDAAGNLALFNRTAREWHGIDALKLPPDQWTSHYDLFGPDGTTPLATELIPLRRAFCGEHFHDAEMTIAAKGQPLRYIQASGRPLYDDKGQNLGAVVGMHDVSEYKRAEQALRESEARFRATFEQAAVGIAHVASDGRFLRINQKFCEIVGYTQEQILKRTFQEITHPDDVDSDLQQADRLLRGEIETYSMEKRYIRQDGSQIWVNWTVSLVRNKAGEPDWRVTVIQDITDLKRAQQESLDREKLESLGTLANGIAHDFNNLMGAILSQAELAQVEFAAGLYPEEPLKGIKDVAIRGSEIVRELMIYAQKESALVELVDVSRLTEEMLGLLGVSVSKHAKLETDLGQDLPAARANAAQLRRIVMNLVTNASEAIGDRDGVIRLATKLVTVSGGSSGLKSGALGDGDYLQLEVSDTGSGMSVETQARIFEPFFTTKPLGHGLGLAVVHGIVRSLGGAIFLASELCKGTTFQVLLPCAPTPAAGTRSPISPTEETARPSSGDATILVVEDEDSLRVPVATLLRKAGISVVEAGDGTAALEAIREHTSPINFLLLDVTLPGASSQEVLEEARRLRPELQVIVTSAYSADAAAKLLHAKVEHFLRKPYRIGDLIDLVRTLW